LTRLREDIKREAGYKAEGVQVVRGERGSNQPDGPGGSFTYSRLGDPCEKQKSVDFNMGGKRIGVFAPTNAIIPKKKISGQGRRGT